MTKWNKETIQELTRLCRIECTEEEQDLLLNDLQKIFAYVEQLQEVETEGVAPCYHVLGHLSNVMREDEIGQVLNRDDFLANAPSQIGGMVRVPPVLKQT